MEVSVIGCSQVKIGTTDSPYWKLGFFSSKQIFTRKNKVCFNLARRWTTAEIQVSLKATQPEVSGLEKIAGERAMPKGSKLEDELSLFVGLPLDAVSHSNTLNHVKAIGAGLKALKLLGVEGVEFPIWWGIAEKEARGKYDWSGYLELAEMVRDAGLKLRVSVCFHAAKQAKIELPGWVSKIGEAQPDIFFTDRSGRRYKECLSLAVDDLPVLDGKTPVQVYQEFLDSFKSSFSNLMGSTIVDVSVSLGPDGELRYPSRPSARGGKITGAGEFQSYDKNMLKHLQEHAQATGNPFWGLSGPHDAPNHDQSPFANTFFKENGGSWETPYGDFFLTWYSTQLMSHADRLLSLASTSFSDAPVTLSGRLPLLHSWYKTRSHPSELTAGFYNTANRVGYDAIAELFARNSCRMIVPGMDLSDAHQPQQSLASPESLRSQIMGACRKHGVRVSGENSSLSLAPEGFEQIKKNLCGENAAVMDGFTYQRMGAYFFSPEHFPCFTEFVRSLNQPGLHSDDQTAMTEEGEGVTTVTLCRVSESEKKLEAQVA
ncbi:PREDICTED: inactive beta-amylase 9-like [Nelumbo nucifera]|uniref:Beta-amylase n=1 Tax=Nelumbo nucifera TaxID=4432 RepID=A0A1U7YXR2_NELNU|nr:PREDICTED: inactive beta-amylase 9-like [Nelumbo nucifera]